MAKAKAAKKKKPVGHLVSDAKVKTRADAFSLTDDQIEAIARNTSDAFQHIVGREWNPPNRLLGRARTMLGGGTIKATGDKIEKAETALYVAVVRALIPHRANGSD